MGCSGQTQAAPSQGEIPSELPTLGKARSRLAMGRCPLQMLPSHFPSHKSPPLYSSVTRNFSGFSRVRPLAQADVSTLNLNVFPFFWYSHSQPAFLGILTPSLRHSPRQSQHHPLDPPDMAHPSQSAPVPWKPLYKSGGVFFLFPRFVMLRHANLQEGDQLLCIFASLGPTIVLETVGKSSL